TGERSLSRQRNATKRGEEPTRQAACLANQPAFLHLERRRVRRGATETHEGVLVERSNPDRLGVPRPLANARNEDDGPIRCMHHTWKGLDRLDDLGWRGLKVIEEEKDWAPACGARVIEIALVEGIRTATQVRDELRHEGRIRLGEPDEPRGP